MNCSCYLLSSIVKNLCFQDTEYSVCIIVNFDACRYFSYTQRYPHFFTSTSKPCWSLISNSHFKSPEDIIIFYMQDSYKKKIIAAFRMSLIVVIISESWPGPVFNSIFWWRGTRKLIFKILFWFLRLSLSRIWDNFSLLSC